MISHEKEGYSESTRGHIVAEVLMSNLIKFKFRKQLVLFISFILCFTLTGCSLSYIIHAAAGQFRLINKAIPVNKAIKAGTLSSEQKEKLRLVASIKEFGINSLGLKATGSYGTVNLQTSRRPIYVISACPKDSLTPVTWWFPVVGDMPYLGFFDKARAKEEKKELFDKNFDVIMGMADAYSTLGWFDDPVTMNLLQGSTPDLVETILHEMTHTHMYLKGQSEFNESLALIVGKIGALQFLIERFGAWHPYTIHALNSIEDEKIFSAFLDSFLSKLEELYESSLSYDEKIKQREKVFSTELVSFSRIKQELKTARFKGFGNSSINNAYLVSLGLYHRYYLLFERAFTQNNESLKEMIQYFKELSEKDNNIIDLLKDPKELADKN